MAKTKELDIRASVTTNEVIQSSDEQKESGKQRLARCIEEDIKIVRGRFRNLESPGSLFKVPPLRKYKGIEFKGQWMSDGEIYSIPKWVANHLNGFDSTASAIDGQVHSCQYPVNKYKSSSLAFPTKNLNDDRVEPEKWVSRYRFESMEFEKVM